MESIPSLQEFKECVRESYRPLLESENYRELPIRKGKYANQYSLRIGNHATVIEVEGIHYGDGAWTKVFRASEADSKYYGLPIFSLMNDRAPLTPKSKKRGEVGQLAQIREDAARMIAYAPDVLAGDFTALDAVVEKERLLAAERRARMPSPEQRAANVAASEAGHAFKAGKFDEVVKLLGPHLEFLPKSQQNRYKQALNQS